MKKLAGLMIAALTSFISADQYQDPCMEYHSSYTQNEVTQVSSEDNHNDILKGNKKTPADKDIGKKIHELLKTDKFSKGFQNFAFNVTNGKVTLIGSVNSLESKNEIEESVKKIEGVKSVDNQLTIFNFEQYPEATKTQ